MQDWIPTGLEHLWCSSWSKNQRWVYISLSPHPRGNVTKVNILYQGLNYHVVDEATIYSVSGWRDPGLGLGIRPMVDHLF